MENKEVLQEVEHFTKLVEEQSVSWWGNFTPAGEKRLRNRYELVVKIAGLDKSMLVLEVGCGMGPLTQYLAESGASIKAIDITPALIDIACSQVKRSNVSFEVANAYELPYPNNTFDLAVGYGILHHLNLGKALPEVKRVIKPGSKIVFFEPNLLNPQVFLEKKVPFIGKKLQNSPGETAFVRWFLKEKLEKYGFRKVFVHPFDFLHPSTPKFLIRFVDSVGKFLEKCPLIKEFAGSLIVYAEK